MCGVWLIREEECGLQNYKGKNVKIPNQSVIYILVDKFIIYTNIKCN